MTLIKLPIQSLFTSVLGFALVSLLLLTTACSPKSGTALAEDAPLENYLLWEITADHLEKPSYLFGTIHLIDSESFFWPEGLLSAFDQSEEVVFEIDMGEMSDMSAMMGIMQKAFMADGTTLSDLLSEEDYALVESHFNELGIPFFMLDRIKPLFLTMMTDSEMVGQGAGIFEGGGSMKSYEVELNNMAEASGKPVSGLESVEYQMSIFDSIPYRFQADILVESIKNPLAAEGGGSLEEITAVYLRQDIEYLAGMVEDDDAGFGEYTDLVLKNRNIDWIQPMIYKMQKGSVFFAVGAGHLAGEYGVIKLLKKEGYHLAPYRPKD